MVKGLIRTLSEVQRTGIKFVGLLQELHVAIEKKYGHDYSDLDIDEIIDAVEYGGGGLTFERLDKLMRETIKKKELDE